MHEGPAKNVRKFIIIKWIALYLLSYALTIILHCNQNNPMIIDLFLWSLLFKHIKKYASWYV